MIQLKHLGGPTGEWGNDMSSPVIKLLLVEDDAGDARLIRETVHETATTPVQLTHVGRLGDALTALGAEDFDVVLLDLSLPDGRGLKTVDRVRDTAPHVPVMVLTDTDDEALALMSLQLGVQDYLVKGHFDRNLLGRAIRYAIERHRMQMTLLGLALIDELTGLYNRRGFLTLADHHLKLARRTRRGLWLLLADLDSLKQINDTFSHGEGDRALVRTAEILRKTFRDSDVIARLGGDDFAALVVHASDVNVQNITTRLQQNVAHYNAQKDHAYELALSFGVARFDPVSPAALDELMTQADRALYEHKRSKRIT